MKQRLTVLAGTALVALVTGSALAQSNRSYECTLGTVTRRVEVAYTTAAAVPCEVRYYKESGGQGGAQVLWSAQNESGYCEQKAQDFVAKLQGMGWMCSEAAASGKSPSAGGDEAAADATGK